MPNIWLICSCYFKSVSFLAGTELAATEPVGAGSLDMLNRFISRFQSDGFVLALIGTVAVSAFLPCQGTSAEIFHALGSFAVAS
jgi:hypothetical protein